MCIHRHIVGLPFCTFGVLGPSSPKSQHVLHSPPVKLSRRRADTYPENPLYVSTTRTIISCPVCKLKKFERTETRCPRCHHSLGISYFEISLPDSLTPLSPHKAVNLGKELGGLIRTVRSSRDTTQSTLASLTGIHRTYLSRIECGRVSPSIISLLLIARALGIDKLLVRVRRPSD